MAGARIQLKRGTAAAWTAANTVLFLGEIGYETDTKKFKVGDGTTAWTSLTYTSVPLSLSTLNDLGDVTISSAADGDFLRWNGTAWINDAVNLGTDTTGSFVQSLTAGTGVTLTNNSGENTTPTIAIGQSVGTGDSVTFVNVTAALTGNASTATTLQTARNIAGQSFNGSANISIAPTDLTGVTSSAAEINILDGATLSTTELNYVDGVTSAIQTQIDLKAPLASPTFTGTVTVPTPVNNTDASTKLYVDSAASTAVGNANTALSNHSADTTDVHGIADTSILVTTTGTQTLTNKTITSPSGLVKGDVGLGNVDNTADTAKPVSTAQQTALDLKANLASPTFTGTVVLPDNTVALGTKTTGDYVATITGGTGVTSTAATTGEGTTHSLSIGQAVATTDNVTFAGVTADAIKVGVTGANEIDTVSGDLTIDSAGGTVTVDDNLTVTGNLTVSGTTTSVNTETLTVDDNIIVLNNNATGAPSENAGIEVERGSSTNVVLRWNETSDKWEATNDGTVYGNLVTTADSGTITSTMIADGTIVNADIDASAAIVDTKLATISTAGKVSNSATTATDANTASAIVARDASGNFTAGTVTAALTGNASTATTLATARNIAGQSFNGSANISIAPTDLTGVTSTAAELNILDGATLSTAELNFVDGVTSAIQTQIDAKAPLASPTFTGTVTIPTGASITAPTGLVKGDVGLGNVDNTSDANKPVSTAGQTALDLKANLASPTFTGTVTVPTPTNSTDAVTKAYADSIAAGINWHGAVELATAAALPNTPTYSNGSSGVGATLTASANARLVIDGANATTGDRVLVKNQANAVHNGIYVVTEQGSVSLAYVLTRAVDGDGNVDDEVVKGDAVYVDEGATNINQGFILTSDGTGANDKHIIGTDSLTWTQFTGTANITAGTGITKTGNSLAIGQAVETNSNVTFNQVTAALVGNASTATTLQTARNIAGQSFNGSANISIAPTDLTGVTSSAAEINILDGATLSTTELNYVDGVTSAIQTQLDAKAPLASPTFTGTVTIPTGASITAPTGLVKGDVGLGNVDNTSNATERAATATLTNKTLTYPVINTPTGLVKGDVGLGSVDNTADTAKPVSTAQQTALDLKANLASPTFTGTVTVPTPTNNTDAATKLYVDTAVSGASISALNDIGDVTITAVATGDYLKWSGTAFVNDDIDLGTDTVGDYVATITGGTGVTSSAATTGEGTAHTLSIGQAVGTSDNVTFAGVTADNIKVGVTGANEIDTVSGDLTIDSAGGTVTVDDNLTVTGNLTVSGTTTSVNTETLTVDDNIIVLNNNATGAPSQDAGIEIERGSSTNVQLRWNETNDKWEITTDGSAYGNIATETYADAVVTAARIITAAGGDGTAGQALTTNGSGTLDFTTITGTTEASIISAVGGDGSSGQVLKTNGSGDLSFGDVALGTNTTGNYMADVSAGTGISITHTPAEGSTATIALADVSTSAQTATYTLVLADKNKIVEMNVASGNNLTVPPNSSVAFPVGSQINILQTGAGQTTIVEGAGVTVNRTPGLKLRAQWSYATLIKRAENTWVLVGDISA